MLFLYYLQGVCQEVVKLSLPPWLARELEPTENCFLTTYHPSFIVHSVGADSLMASWLQLPLLIGMNILKQDSERMNDEFHDSHIPYPKLTFIIK
jgi:hypothetical protein